MPFGRPGSEKGMRQKSSPAVARWPSRDARPTAIADPDHFVGTLPLTYIEEIFLLTDAPEQPATFHFELRVEGRLDADRLSTAIQQGARRHPLARARLLPVKATDLTWHLEVMPDHVAEVLSVAECSTDSEFEAVRDGLANTPLPTDRSPLFRVVLVHHPKGDRVLLLMHHVISDGIGAIRFARSVQRAYAGEDDPPAAIELMVARDLRTLLAASDRSERRRRRQAAHPTPRELLGWKQCVLANEGGTSSSVRQRILDARLSTDEVEAVRRRRLPGATVNDVLIVAHHLTYERWNRGHGQSNDRIGTIMPFNMRPAAFRSDLLGNYSLGLSVSTYASGRRNFGSTVQAVADITCGYKRTNGAGAQQGPAMLSRVPVGVKRYLGRKFPQRFLDGLFSNLGSIPPFGPFGSEGGRVTEVRFSQYVVGQHVGFVACGLGDEISVSVRYREADLDKAAAQTMLDLFREVLLHAP